MVFASQVKEEKKKKKKAADIKALADIDQVEPTLYYSPACG